MIDETYLDNVHGPIESTFLGLGLVLSTDGVFGVLLALFLELAVIDTLLSLLFRRSSRLGGLSRTLQQDGLVSNWSRTHGRRLVSNDFGAVRQNIPRK